MNDLRAFSVSSVLSLFFTLGMIMFVGGKRRFGLGWRISVQRLYDGERSPRADGRTDG